MRSCYVLLSLLCFVAFKSVSAQQRPAQVSGHQALHANEGDPEVLVQRQLEAYNALDLEAFLATYADEVELYLFPDKLLGKGKAFMRQHYSTLFSDFPQLHAEIKGRIRMGDIIIDKESVSGAGPENIEAVAIYEVKGGKIVKVHFIQ